MSKDNKEAKEKKNKKKSDRFSFFTSLIAEIKRVNWPDLTKTKKTCASVFFVIIIFSLVLWLIDTSVYGVLSSLGFFKPHQNTAKPQIPVTDTVNPVPSSVSGNQEAKPVDKNKKAESEKEKTDETATQGSDSAKNTSGSDEKTDK